MKLSTLTVFLSLLVSVVCQDYGDQARRGAVARRRNNNRGPLMAFVAGGVFGGAVGAAIGYRRSKMAHLKEKTDLVNFIKLQDSQMTAIDKQWQAEYLKVFTAYQALDKETEERDYEEFKAPDTDNDDMISRYEFNSYVRKYLSSFPELSEKDFPKFEEFDINSDGKVSFAEWQEFLKLQKETEAKKAKASTAENNVYDNLLTQMYEESDSASDFRSMNKNMDSNKKNNGQRKGLPKAGSGGGGGRALAF